MDECVPCWRWNCSWNAQSASPPSVPASSRIPQTAVPFPGTERDFPPPPVSGSKTRRQIPAQSSADYNVPSRSPGGGKRGAQNWPVHGVPLTPSLAPRRRGTPWKQFPAGPHGRVQGTDVVLSVKILQSTLSLSTCQALAMRMSVRI